MSPALAVPYASDDMVEGAMTPEMDDTLTIIPPAAFRCGAAARAQRYAPLTLTSRVMSHISSVNASMSVIGTPAGDAGVVHQDVQAPEALHRLRDHVAHVAIVTHVAVHADGLGAQRPYLFR